MSSLSETETEIKTKINNNLKFPKFEDIPVSTKTFTANTNLKIEIKELFESLPITPYIVIAKKRGRKNERKRNKKKGKREKGERDRGREKTKSVNV